MMRLGMMAVTVLLLAGACTGVSGGGTNPAPSGRSSGSPEQVTGELSCAAIIGTNVEIPPDYETILDVIALPTVRSAGRALQTSRDEESQPPNYFAKAGLVVRAGSAFTLEVNQAPERALIGWGSPAEFGSVLSTEGCAGKGWLAFAGGFRVREPTCLELKVEFGENQESIHVGVGAPCRGQQPPAAS